MTRAKDIPAAVAWHEGMALAPQHFQLAARRGEALSAYHAAASMPFAWGLRTIQFDESALTSGTVRVTHLEALLPDGLVGSIQPGVDESLELRLQEELPGRLLEGPLVIHLAVARRSEQSEHIEQPLRFRQNQGTVVGDELGGGSDVLVPTLSPRLQLLTQFAGDPEPDARFVAMPVARFEWRQEALKPDSGYQPPIIEVSGDGPLVGKCNELATLLRQRMHDLAARLARPSDTSPARLAALSNQLAAFNAIGPELEAMVASRACHPFPLFLLLVRACGSMAALERSSVPPVFKAYDHGNLSRTFAQVFRYIRKVLNTVAADYDLDRFTFAKHRYSLKLKSEWRSEKVLIGVRIPAKSTEAQMSSWIASAIIGPGSLIQSLLAKRSLGAGRKRAPATRSSDLGLPTDYLLVELNGEDVVFDEDLVVTAGGAAREGPRPAEIVLVRKTSGLRPP